jgi:uracil-DNA glycosylase
VDIERPGAEHWVPPDPTVQDLRVAVDGCRGCELWQGATQAVFSAGPPDAPLVLVGEQPGDQEDRQGVPFVGPAGRVLDDALRAAGIDPATAYVTNAVKHFRFEERGKRRIHKSPGVPHIVACRPWLTAELDLVAPRVIVALGATAGRAVLGRTVRVTAERGRLLEEPAGPAVLLTVHPSAVLRLRGTPEWDAAFEELAADLRVAASAVQS